MSLRRLQVIVSFQKQDSAFQDLHRVRIPIQQFSQFAEILVWNKWKNKSKTYYEKTDYDHSWSGSSHCRLQ